MKTYQDLRESLVKTSQEQPDEIGVIGIREEMVDLIPEATLISVVKKHYPDIKITQNLLEKYRTKTKARSLNPDKVVQELRKMNPADCVFEGHVEYQLQTGQVVVISEEMDGRLNKLLSEHPIVHAYMNESVSNFMDVVNELEE